VLADRGPLEYRDAETFFRKTYPTQGLLNLLSAILSRLSGRGKGEAVIQIQTPFGGGKTHSLIALYHASRNWGLGIRDWGLDIPEPQTPNSKPQVATFVGTAADPLKGKTPWGELAEQLGRYPLLREYLKSQEPLLDKIPPHRLLQKTLREDEQEKPLADIADAFRKYPQLPMLESEAVVRTAVIRGVREKVFGGEG